MLPAVLGRLHPRFKTPHLAFVAMGVVSTGLLVGGALLSNSQSNIFWMTFRVTALCLLLCYLLVFPAFLVLRRTRPDQPRPYRAARRPRRGGRGGVGLHALHLRCVRALLRAVADEPGSSEGGHHPRRLDARDDRGGVPPDAAGGRDRPLRYDSGRPRDGAAETTQRQETQSMAQNLTGRARGVRVRPGPDRQEDPHAARAEEGDRGLGPLLDRLRQPGLPRVPEVRVDRLHGRRVAGRGSRLPRHPGQGVPRHASAASASTSPATGIPKVLKAVREQLDRQAIHSQELIDPLRTYLAHLVAMITPGDLQYAFFTNSGHGVDRGLPQDGDPDDRAAPLRRDDRGVPRQVARLARRHVEGRCSASRSCR